MQMIVLASHLPSGKRRRLSNPVPELHNFRDRSQLVESSLETWAYLYLLRDRLDKLEERSGIATSWTPSANTKDEIRRVGSRLDALEDVCGIPYLKKTRLSGGKLLCPIEGCEHSFGTFRALTGHFDKTAKKEYCGRGHRALFNILEACRESSKVQGHLLEERFWAALNMAGPATLDDCGSSTEPDPSAADSVRSDSSNTSTSALTGHLSFDSTHASRNISSSAGVLNYPPQHLQNSNESALAGLDASASNCFHQTASLQGSNDSTALVVPGFHVPFRDLPKEQRALHPGHLLANSQDTLDASTEDGMLNNALGHDNPITTYVDGTGFRFTTSSDVYPFGQTVVSTEGALGISTDGVVPSLISSNYNTDSVLDTTLGAQGLGNVPKPGAIGVWRATALRKAIDFPMYLRERAVPMDDSECEEWALKYLCPST